MDEQDVPEQAQPGTGDLSQVGAPKRSTSVQIPAARHVQVPYQRWPTVAASGVHRALLLAALPYASALRWLCVGPSLGIQPDGQLL